MSQQPVVEETERLVGEPLMLATDSAATMATLSRAVCANETIYLCNFRVSVDGDWLCLKELHDLQNCVQLRDSDYFRETYGKKDFTTTFLPFRLTRFNNI